MCLNSLNSQELEQCTTPNSSTNQGPWVRNLIHVMYIRHILSSILITGRNAHGEMRALRCSTGSDLNISLKEANFSVMTTIPICQDLELFMAPFLNSQLTLTHQLEWDCKCPFFQEDQFKGCLKIPNPLRIKRSEQKYVVVSK